MEKKNEYHNDQLEATIQADLQKAHDSLRQLRLEEEAIKESIGRLEWQIGYLGGLLTAGSTPALFDHPAASRRFTGITAPVVIEAILGEANGPLSVTELVDTAMAGGFGTDSGKVYRYFSSYLARTSKKDGARISKVGRGLFTINRG